MTTAPLPDDPRAARQAQPGRDHPLRPDGQPVSVATWYLLDGDRILVNMDEGRKRLDHLRNDPRVSLTALDESSWYTHVSVQGRVVELARRPRPRGHRPAVAALHRRRPTRPATARRVSAWIEIDSWHGWGAAARTSRPAELSVGRASIGSSGHVG